MKGSLSIKPLAKEASKLDAKSWTTLKKLSTPSKIQDFINKIPFNFDSEKETYMSPARVLKENKAHCFEGALLAALALWIHGEKPLILDLRTAKGDIDHVVTLFKRNGKWGAISKTNHAVLRYREPVYLDERELVMSYFHEYFLSDGKKTLRRYSNPFDLSKIGTKWITDEEELFHLVDLLDESKHFDILSPKQIRNLRKADEIEIKAGKIEEWKR